MTSRPEGLREEILPPEVTLISGLLTISRRSSTVSSFIASSNLEAAASSMRRKSSCRTISSSSRSLRISSRISRSSNRRKGGSSRRGNLSLGRLKSSLVELGSPNTKGITLKQTRLRSEQVQRKYLQLPGHGIHRVYQRHLLHQHFHCL